MVRSRRMWSPASVRPIAVALAGVVVLASCTGPSETRTSAPTAPAIVSADGSRHVVVIAMENTTPQQAFGAPYLASLSASALVFSSYHSVAHPSLPNYLALTSGQTWSIRDDGHHVLAAGQDLGAQLTAARIPWRAYMEGMTAGCLNSPAPYAVWHNPFAYYGGTCPPNVVSFASLATDLGTGLAPFTWITPDLCHDGHDCGATAADAWLRTIVPQVTASPGWQPNGVLILVWDEGSASRPDEAPLVVVTARGRAGTVETSADAYSVLATIEELYGLTKLGSASDARSFTALLD
ncbi:MAG: phosphatidylinositol-3-phosphatase [Chloroflexota bacterium]|nr:phosphatidylinositol-3-phosphatase [Chloroflexota bacterium]